jgi:predicted nucleic acid-binding protein
LRSVETALCDTGPLVALFSRGQFAQEECEAGLRDFGGTLVTTLGVLTEAFHFVEQPDERDYLWKFVLGGALEVAEVSLSDFVRMHRLMIEYADLPMDFADASLVVVGERLKLTRVFTLDAHFRVYRPGHARCFDVFP